MSQPVMLKSWSWMVLWRPTIPSRTNTQKRCPFHHRGLEYKSRKSRDTWCNRQVWPWNTKGSRARLTEFCHENTLVIANTLFQKHKRWLYIKRWTSEGQYWNQIDCILCSQDGDALYSQQKQDGELTLAQIMNSLLPNSDLNWRK